jgi:hypothetical protein
MSMNTGNEAMGDGFRAAHVPWEALGEDIRRNIADLTAERDAARADNAALVEALRAKLPTGGGGALQRCCGIVVFESDAVQHKADCALATHGETGRALLAELEALRQFYEGAEECWSHGNWVWLSNALAAHRRFLAAVPS